MLKIKNTKHLDTAEEIFTEFLDKFQKYAAEAAEISKWSAVKDRNEDAFAALSQEFERSSRILAEEWAQTSALAKIAVISESND